MRPNQHVVTKINLLVLNDVEHELVVEEADEMEATKPNQTRPTCGNQNQPTCSRWCRTCLVIEEADDHRVVTKINLLVLDDVEHELIMEEADEMKAVNPNQPELYLVIYNVQHDLSFGRRMRGSCQSKPTYANKPNLFVLHDVEHELIEQGDETKSTCGNQNQPTCAQWCRTWTRPRVGGWDGSYQTKPNQCVVTKPNLLVLDDVEHELVV